MLLVIISTLLVSLWGSSCEGGRSKRGFYADSHGQRQLTYDYLNDNQNIALWSAQSAVTSSVGQVYGHQQAQLATAVRNFLNTKDKRPSHLPHRSHYSRRRYQPPYRTQLESPHSPSNPPIYTPPNGHPHSDPWTPNPTKPTTTSPRRRRPRPPKRQHSRPSHT